MTVTKTKGFSVPPMSVDASMAMEDVIEVFDACRVWFDFCGLPYVAADLLTMANMVMKREREHRDAAKRSKWERQHGIEEPA
jgi:hypothetical protein